MRSPLQRWTDALVLRLHVLAEKLLEGEQHLHEVVLLEKILEVVARRAGASRNDLQDFLKEHNFVQVLLALKELFRQHMKP